MLQNKLKSITVFLGVALLASAFFSLGMWQWNRAQDSQKTLVVDKTLVTLESISQPRTALASAATLRHVKVTGKYVATYKAPNQVDGKGNVSDWQVALLATNSGAAILVVRDQWSQMNKVAPGDDLTVTGVLMPHQSDNRAESAPGVLSRIDSALVVAQTPLDLYDGFVIADSEQRSDMIMLLPSITPPAPSSAVPGFYWQHISYVIIWWLMVGVVIYLFLYQRRFQSRVNLEANSEESEL